MLEKGSLYLVVSLISFGLFFKPSTKWLQLSTLVARSHHSESLQNTLF